LGMDEARQRAACSYARKVEVREDSSPKEQFRTIWLYDIVLRALYYVHGKQWRESRITNRKPLSLKFIPYDLQA
jgi:hypothetical protein